MPITGQETANSPQVSRDTIANVVRKRIITYDRGYDWESEMPTLGTLNVSYGYFRSYTSAPRGPYIDVTLTYDTESTITNFQPGDTDEEFFASSSGREKPIELIPGYLTKWNYGVYYKNTGVAAKTIAADFPGGAAGYNAATDLSDLDGIAMLWSKDHPGYKWVKLADPIKPGIEAVLAPAIVVIRKTWHSTQAAAEADLAAVGIRVAPAETFGASPATANYWLVTHVDTNHDGRYWVATSEYSHAVEGWDGDLYS